MKTQIKSINLPRQLLNAALLLAALCWVAPVARGDWPPWSPNVKTFFVQHPDVSTNGLDVLACKLPQASQGVMLADDWICRGPSPVTDIHIWGSWLNDLVDSQAVFWIGIWSDVPATAQTPSHPGQLHWSQVFHPGEYRARLWRSGVQEKFLDPGPPAIIGQDHQIWQYNFYLRNQFNQWGRPEAPVVYWLSVMVQTQSGRVFGWKTTVDHFNDAGVFAPATMHGPAPTPEMWQVVRKPEGKKLEFSFAMTSSQVWGINKDFYNRYPFLTTNLRVRFPGYLPVMDHFDGPLASPWTFTWDWETDVTATVLNWVSPLPGLGSSECLHVGYTGPGVFPPILNWGWWDSFNSVWLGDVVQFNIGWPRPLPMAPYLIGITNILPPPPPPWTPFTNYMSMDSLRIEYYTNAVPLDTLNKTSVRAPLATMPVPIMPAQRLVPPGAAVSLQAPPPPPHATYAVVVAQVSPVSETGVALTNQASTDWIMLPTTLPESDPPTPRPQVLSPAVNAGEVTLTWTSMPGVIYQVKRCAVLVETPVWETMEGNVIAVSGTTSKTFPAEGAQFFYRVEVVTP